MKFTFEIVDVSKRVINRESQIGTITLPSDEQILRWCDLVLKLEHSEFLDFSLKTWKNTGWDYFNNLSEHNALFENSWDLCAFFARKLKVEPIVVIAQMLLMCHDTVKTSLE